MDEKNSVNKAALVLVLSVITGLLGGYLFEPGRYGLNLVIFSIVLTWFYSLLYTISFTPRHKLLFILTAVFLIFAIFWRESASLRIMNITAFIALIVLFQKSSETGIKVKLYAKDFIYTLAKKLSYVIVSPFHLFRVDAIKISITNNAEVNTRALLRGVFISIPIVVVFAVLFGLADVRFSNFIDELFTIDFSIIHYLPPAIVSTFIAVAFLRGKFSQHVGKQHIKEDLGLKVGAIEIATVLISLNILFLMFIFIQLSYFFGSDTLVKVSVGVTYSNYARSGFFELVSVATIAILALWVVDWLVRGTSIRGKSYVRRLSLIMILLLVVIEASAVHRMVLYTKAYGLTELRFYPTVFMIWIATVFAAFVFTILRGKREYFLPSALVTGIVIIIGVNFINPNAYISRYNMQRESTLSLDTQYLTKLGNDAVPAIVENLKMLPQSKQKKIFQMLRMSMSAQKGDWRTFTLSRFHAFEAYYSVFHKSL